MILADQPPTDPDERRRKFDSSNCLPQKKRGSGVKPTLAATA
jgi:hypothetical protein